MNFYDSLLAPSPPYAELSFTVHSAVTFPWARSGPAAAAQFPPHVQWSLTHVGRSGGGEEEGRAEGLSISLPPHLWWLGDGGGGHNKPFSMNKQSPYFSSFSLLRRSDPNVKTVSTYSEWWAISRGARGPPACRNENGEKGPVRKAGREEERRSCGKWSLPICTFSGDRY